VEVRILFERDIRDMVDMGAAVGIVEAALKAYSQGKALQPDVTNLDFRDSEGEVHVKSAYLTGSDHFAVKVASGFYRNPELGLPVGSGLVLVFDAGTGMPKALLFDNGYITELRTGAAGAVACKYLSAKNIETVGMIGAGSQARYQFWGLMQVRSPERLRVWSRSRERAKAYGEEMSKLYGVDAKVCEKPDETAEGVEAIVTVTPSRKPLVHADSVGSGTHVTAVGSDGPGKQELDTSVLLKADKVVVDSLKQCSQLGELQHVISAGLMKTDDVYAELGEIVMGMKKGREDEDEITVCDLTGLGVQDAAVADFVTRRAMERGVGEYLRI